MHRFYTTCQNISGDTILISDKNQVHHIRNVLRLKIKEEVVIFDDKGNEYSSIIEKILPKSVIFKIKKKLKSFPQKNKLKITVACAIPKKSKMDEIIDKLTQLGVDRIIPLETQRVVIRLDEHKKILRQKRWQKIALNASLQSQRSNLPIIEPIRKIKEVLSKVQDFDLKLIPTLRGNRKSLRETLDKFKPKNILVLIGPEGDFSPDEVESAKRAGFIPLSLGDLILRVETAAITVASFIRLLYEDG
jgi:16S rRNA (uracil1498-N3)-methyltransferase